MTAFARRLALWAGAATLIALAALGAAILVDATR